MDRLIALMQRVDLERPGQRLAESPDGSVGQLVTSLNAMFPGWSWSGPGATEAERHRIAQELHDEIGQEGSVWCSWA